MDTVSRVEVMHHVETVFAGGPATQEALFQAAAGSAARPAVLELLERLPHQPYRTLRDLWYELPDVPVG